MARSSRQGPSKTDFLLNRRTGSFAADVDRIVVNTEKRMQLVMQRSLLLTINEMQLAGGSVASTKFAISKMKKRQGPVTQQGKGGRMRVDTGFLRASGQSSLNGMPTGPDMKPKDAQPGSYKWDSQATELILGQMQFGSVFHWGWTANYARYREAYDGFMGAALQNWQQTVNSVVAEARKRFP